MIVSQCCSLWIEHAGPPKDVEVETAGGYSEIGTFHFWKCCLLSDCLRVMPIDNDVRSNRASIEFLTFGRSTRCRCHGRGPG